ncbi:hypothetical protein [Tomitella gaofuii]|uniref:hypothetical protein n=1 Tax=Tomitella gaofuii TaxID=2760083 RepID=UPI0020C079BE|nr:hypothetical protein [Tomitella gaofuii]
MTVSSPSRSAASGRRGIRFRPSAGLMTPDDVAELAAYAEAERAAVRIDPRAAITVVHPHGGPGRSPDAAPLRLSVPEWDGARSSWHVLCSALTGRAGGVRDVRAPAEALARLLAQRDPPVSTRDPLVTVDDGRGDVAGGHAPLSVIASDIGGYLLEVSGTPVGVRIPDRELTRAVDAVVELLEAEPRAAAPRAAETAADGRGTAAGAGALAPAVHRLLRDVPEVAELPGQTGTVPSGADGAAAADIGWFDHDAGGGVTLGAAIDGAVLDARRLQFLAAIGCAVIVGPRRTLLLCDLGEGAAEQVVRVLAPMGFVFDAASPTVRELHLSCAPPSPGSAPNAAP